MKYSLIIGIENFTDKEIGNVGHAADDAKAIAAAFKEFGYAEANQQMLINEKATRNSVEYELKQILKCAVEEDEILIFFSSHGCSSSGQSYLVCHDSRHKDLAGTSIPIREVFNLMNSTRCHKVMLFLDCCHAGLQFPKEEKNIMGSMSDAEIKDFLPLQNFASPLHLARTRRNPTGVTVWDTEFGLTCYCRH